MHIRDCGSKQRANALIAKQLDPFCDPGRYISPDVHQFDHRFVRKHSMKEDIDRLCDDADKFDIYFSCLVSRDVPLRSLLYGTRADEHNLISGEVPETMLLVLMRQCILRAKV